MKKVLVFFLILIILVLGIFLYNISTNMYITAKFRELRPFQEHLPVYYKGLVVGRASEKKHSEDYKHTFINIVLHKKNIMLPENTQVFLKKEKRDDKERDFLELIYPKEPSSIMISNGSVLEGIATVDVDTFMANLHPDDIEQMKQNLVQSTENLSIALEGLSELMVLLQDMVKENNKNFVVASKNIAQTTDNINQLSQKINGSLNPKTLDDSFQNIYRTTQNLNNISGNLTTTTQSFNVAMPQIDSILYEVHGVASNTNLITKGVKNTLSKRFGGLRLLFGRTVNESNVCR